MLERENAKKRYTLQLTSLTATNLAALLQSLESPKVTKGGTIYSWQSTITTDCGNEVTVVRDKDDSIIGYRIVPTELCHLEQCEYHGNVVAEEVPGDDKWTGIHKVTK